MFFGVNATANRDYEGEGYFQLFDLSLIYGVGNEPTTVEQFEADYLKWFGKPLTYEPYDEGSLRPVLMQSVKTTGFNQWDEQWEGGAIEVDTGEKVPNAGVFRSINYIPCFGGVDYYFHCTYNSTSTYCAVLFYDANKNFIKNISGGKNYIFCNHSVFTTPVNAKYMKFYAGGKFKNDICINISNPDRNGTYEPYEEHTKTFNVTTLKGKLNGAGESVTIFPDGMKKAGDVQDEIFVEDGVVKAIKRINSVDLGSLNWVYIHAFVKHYYFRVDVSDIKKPSSSDVVGNILCARYKTDTAINVYNNVNNKSISIADPNTAEPLRVFDEQITSQSDFKAAMNGVMLYYELETPETYVLDTPMHALASRYIIDKNGNEKEVTAVYQGSNQIWSKQ